jgi:diacylglycerol kinase family enzyme
MYKSSSYEVCYDQNKEKIMAFMINVANSKQWGNNAFIAPKASLNDGEFTVTIIRPFKWHTMPYMLLSLFFKQIHNNKYVKTFNCTSIEITSINTRNTRFHIDGEPITLSNNTLKLTTAPSTLRVL